MPQRTNKRLPNSNLSNTFISYSHEDQDFVRALAEEFQRDGSAIWIDRRDIERTEGRGLELLARIEAADNFVVVVSPESVASEELSKEIAHAVKYGKRLVPLVRGEVAAALVPQALVALDPIRLRLKDDISSAYQALTKRIDAELKFDLFISYSRKDEKFVRELEGALHTASRKLWVDRRNIRYTEEWLKAIYSGIEAADNFVFVISPDSIVSENCGRELSHAIEHNKRLVPIIHREIDPHYVPRPLAALDWVPFRYTDGFESAFNRLLDAIDTDLDYVRTHTRLLVRSIEWDKAERDKSLLLRGSNLREAEQWRAQAGSAKKPQATALQSECITISRQDANRRQRITAAALATGLVVIIVLAMLAIYQHRIAETQRIEVQRRLAAFYEEQGRQELLSGRPVQALTYLNEALQEGNGEPPVRFMIAQAMHNFDGQVATLNEHTQEVTAIAVSHDGGQIITGSNDGTAKVWNTAGGELLLTLDAHIGGVKSVAFSRDGEKILTAGADNTARMWDARSGSPLVTFSGHEGPVGMVSFSGDGQHILTASGDKTAAVWDVRNGERPLFLLRGHSRPLTLAIFSPDDQLILTAGFDGIAKVWNAQTGKLLSTTPRIDGSSVAAAFSPDSKSIVTGGHLYPSVIIWDARSGHKRAELLDGESAHAGPVTTCAFSHYGRLILTTSRDGTAKVWDARTRQRLLVLRWRTGKVNSAAFSDDDRYIVTAGESGAAEVWDAAEGKLLARLGGHTRSLAAAVFARSGEYVVTIGADKQAIVWDWAAARGTVPILLEGDAQTMRCVAFSPDDRFIVTSGWYGNGKIWQADTGHLFTSLDSDLIISAEMGHALAVFSPKGERMLTVSINGMVRMWEALGGKLLYVREGRENAVMSVAFDADGRRFVTTEGDMKARIWDAQTGHQLLALEGHEREINSAEFSRDGSRVVTASDDSTARLWDAGSGALLKTFAGHANSVISATFSPDGSRIVTASDDRTGGLWDAETGGLLATLDGHMDVLTSAVFSSDGKLIVTASKDRTARIWDGRSGRLLASLEGHTGTVTSAIFGPKDRLVATAGDDGTIRIWDALSGRQLTSFTGYTGSVESMIFSPDKTRLVAVSSDDTVRVWDVHLETRLPNEINMLVKRHVPFSIEGGQLLPAILPRGARR